MFCAGLPIVLDNSAFAFIDCLDLEFVCFALSLSKVLHFDSKLAAEGDSCH